MDLGAEVRALANDLAPLFYEQLKRMAHRERLRLGASSTLQTTAVVNEAYLKLRGSRGWTDDAHFLRAAAQAMRHVLINNAQARASRKRGAGAIHVSQTQSDEIAAENDDDLVALEEALQHLARHSQRLADVVECRYFGGLDEPSTARALGISERTVRRDWVLARAWLYRALSDSREIVA
ncbi:MAG: ECF-type sigma factor [Steroidobacteraceae bacterium]